MIKICRICGGQAPLYHRSFRGTYHKCASCGCVFMDETCFLSPEKEKERYKKHNNDISDTGYRDFLEPVLNAVSMHFEQGASGLDFGCGPGTSAGALLKESGYRIALYDPFFATDEAVLNDKYDFILCTEVMEHFKEPVKEFRLLKSILKPGGAVFCMTQLIDGAVDFEKWSYKNDPTHVIFYTLRSAATIADLAGFGVLETGGRLLIFS